jgi:TRAP-type C4-dicarboxylate transport system substrate-binding protein
VLVNKATWDKLSDAQKDVLRKAGAAGEQEAPAEFAAENEKETKRQAAAGMQTITLNPGVAETYRAKAYQAGWDGIIRQSAEIGPKLKAFFSKTK